MEESQPSERKSHSSIMARVQKLRTRMYVEAVSGVPAASEDLFLPICLRYEQGIEPLFAGQKHVAHSEALEKSSDDRGDWTDFDDWDKYANRGNLDQQSGWADFDGFDASNFDDWHNWQAY